MRYWLNSPDKKLNPEEFAKRSAAVCETYASAPTLHEQGTHTVCTDEKTGMQALERAAQTLPMKPGSIERQEVDSIRHGTQALIANFEVVTGKVICPSIGDSSAVTGYFDLEKNSYQRRAESEQVELLSLTGNLALNNNEPFFHVHVALGLRDGSARGGHLFEAVVRPTVELVLTASSRPIGAKSILRPA